MGRLNTAESRVLYTLLTFHLDKTHVHEGQQVKSDHSGNRLTNMIVLSSDSVSAESSVDRDKETQQLTDLISQIQSAKSAGDRQKVIELVEQAEKRGQALGLPVHLTQRIREMFL